MQLNKDPMILGVFQEMNIFFVHVNLTSDSYYVFIKKYS